jgi:hypothetical protein
MGYIYQKAIRTLKIVYENYRCKLSVLFHNEDEYILLDLFNSTLCFRHCKVL